jgi:hypothetical protein
MAQLPALLQKLRHDYAVLSIDARRVLRYRTDYLDTGDFAFYHAHHNRRARRSKVRCRHYLDSGRAFLEIKGKSNKGLTVKHRVALPADEDLPALASDLMRQVGAAAQPVALQRSVRVDYHRISLSSALHGERASIDLGLNAAERQRYGRAFGLCDLAIVELKQARLNPASPLFRALREMRLPPVSFSKYCVACALLLPDLLKTNRFKPTLMRLAPHLVLPPLPSSCRPGRGAPALRSAGDHCHPRI